MANAASRARAISWERILLRAHDCRNKFRTCRFSESAPTIDSSMLNWQCFDARVQLSNSDRPVQTQYSSDANSDKCSRHVTVDLAAVYSHVNCACLVIVFTYRKPTARTFPATSCTTCYVACIRRTMARIFANIAWDS